MPDLRSELKQSKPFDSPQTEALLNLLRTAETVQYGFAQVFRAKGLTAAQYNVLRILRGAGADGLLCGDIAGRMLSPVPDLTRVLYKLEERQLVSRKRDTGDRRGVRVWIAPAGKTLLRQLDTPLRQAEQVLSRGLEPKEVEELGRLLVKLRDGLAGGDDEG